MDGRGGAAHDEPDVVLPPTITDAS